MRNSTYKSIIDILLVWKWDYWINSKIIRFERKKDMRSIIDIVAKDIETSSTFLPFSLDCWPDAQGKTLELKRSGWKPPAPRLSTCAWAKRSALFAVTKIEYDSMQDVLEVRKSLSWVWIDSESKAESDIWKSHVISCHLLKTWLMRVMLRGMGRVPWVSPLLRVLIMPFAGLSLALQLSWDLPGVGAVGLRLSQYFFEVKALWYKILC